MMTHEYNRLKRCKNLLSKRQHNTHHAKSSIGSLLIDEMSYLTNLNILEDNYRYSLYSL